MYLSARKALYLQTFHARYATPDSTEGTTCECQRPPDGAWYSEQKSQNFVTPKFCECIALKQEISGQLVVNQRQRAVCK